MFLPGRLLLSYFSKTYPVSAFVTNKQRKNSTDTTVLSCCDLSDKNKLAFRVEFFKKRIVDNDSVN